MTSILRSLAALLTLGTLACGTTDRTFASAEDYPELRDAAAAQWAAVGVDAPTDYLLVMADLETLQEACENDSPHLGGCSFPGNCTAILLRGDRSPEQHVAGLVHELGHLMRGPDGPSHLDCPEAGSTHYGNDVMCLTGAAPGVSPTARDAAFVTR